MALNFGLSYDDVQKDDFQFDMDAHDVMVFLHIQKTGGTSFGKHLVQDLDLKVYSWIWFLICAFCTLCFYTLCCVFLSFHINLIRKVLKSDYVYNAYRIHSYCVCVFVS